jgi:hypothetical protein
MGPDTGDRDDFAERTFVLQAGLWSSRWLIEDLEALAGLTGVLMEHSRQRRRTRVKLTVTVRGSESAVTQFGERAAANVTAARDSLLRSSGSWSG